MSSTISSERERSAENSCCGSSATSSTRRKGRCKWFNVSKGWGFVTPDDGSPDIFVHQSVIRMSGFRNLAEGEEVEFETKDAVKGEEATIVTGPGGSECRGSQRHPKKSIKSKRIRCYNCGVVGSHIASKCTMGPQPKRCHQCKAEDHLISECPSKLERRSRTNTKPERKKAHLSEKQTKF
ncbi:protein lin-28 homolog isoform X1 [Daphnia carinata]|uniref:protein lin-28 homolog isoform X1 n=1 Tax=Daphnia carinata TaxID=120202 RepID=UPI00257C9A11|nr:protein lin-28 homolog isoform X1 [Daphnia carinata]